MRKRVMALLLSMGLATSILPGSVLAADFTDVDADHWAKAAIDRWSGYGIVSGDPEGTFRPGDSIKTSEAAKIFAELMKLSSTEGALDFADVADDAWYAEYFAKCSAAGVIRGVGNNDDGQPMADPESQISRERFFVMFARLLNIAEEDSSSNALTQDPDIDDWAQKYINALVNHGYVKGSTDPETGDPSLLPDDPINRASVMSLLNQTISLYADERGKEYTAGDGINLVVAPGVTLKGDAETVVLAPAAENGSLLLKDGTTNYLDIMAPNSSITLLDTAAVKKADIDAENVTIGGSGRLIEAYAAARNAKVNTEGTILTVGEGVTGVTQQNGATVAPGTTVTTPSSTTPYTYYGGGGGGGGGARPITPTTRTLTIEPKSDAKLTPSYEHEVGEDGVDREIEHNCLVYTKEVLVLDGNFDTPAFYYVSKNGDVETETAVSNILDILNVTYDGSTVSGLTATVSFATIPDWVNWVSYANGFAANGDAITRAAEAGGQAGHTVRATVTVSGNGYSGEYEFDIYVAPVYVTKVDVMNPVEAEAANAVEAGMSESVKQFEVAAEDNLSEEDATNIAEAVKTVELDYAEVVLVKASDESVVEELMLTVTLPDAATPEAAQGKQTAGGAEQLSKALAGAAAIEMNKQGMDNQQMKSLRQNIVKNNPLVDPEDEITEQNVSDFIRSSDDVLSQVRAIAKEGGKTPSQLTIEDLAGKTLNITFPRLDDAGEVVKDGDLPIFEQLSVNF